jgi:hypothetical protein
MSIDKTQAMTLKQLHEAFTAILTETPFREDDPVMIKVGEEYFPLNKNMNFRKNDVISLASSQLSAWKGEITKGMNKIQRILEEKE